MPGTSTGRKSRTFGTQTRDGACERTVKTPVSAREKGVQVGTYPDTSEKARLVKAHKEMFPNLKKANNEVYLFMRGKTEMLQRIKNAFVLEKRSVESYHGQLVGISDDLVRLEGDVYSQLPQQYIAIIRFRDIDCARKWTEHSSKFKQKDFPSPADEVEMFAVPVQYIPVDELCAFQLTEMHGLMVDPQQFSENYVKQVAKMLDKRCIHHGVVASNEVTPLRNCMVRRGTYILVNCAKSLKDLQDYYYSDEYVRCKEYRHSSVAENDTCFFTIRPFTS